MKKVVFLDRDGTLNVDLGYTHTVAEYALLPGVREALRALQDAGYALIILTSQSGIGRGMYSEKAYYAYMDHLYADLREAGIEITSAHFCPHHAEEGVGEYHVECDCRKPKPGLHKSADAAHGPFDYAASWSIGDAHRDLEMSKAAHQDIQTILVPKNYQTAHQELVGEKTTAVDYIAQHITEAVDIILGNS